MDSKHLQSPEACLEQCKSVLKPVEATVKALGLASPEQGSLDKVLAAANAFFIEGQMQEFLNSIEKENSTLLLLFSVYST